MLSDRVQLNCPCSSVCKVYLSREWSVMGSDPTYGSYFFNEKQELSWFTLPFPCCFLTKKDITYSKLEIECSKSRLVPGLEFDQFPPQICCFDLTCD